VCVSVCVQACVQAGVHAGGCACVHVNTSQIVYNEPKAF